MIGLQVLALTLAGNQVGSSFVDEKNLELFKTSSIIESPVNEKPGYFIFQQSGTENRTLNIAMAKLKGISVDWIVQKQPNGSTIAWNWDGKLHALKEGAIPDKILVQLKVGEPVVKLKANFPIYSRETPVNISINNSPFFTREKDPTVISSWVFLGKQKAPYISKFINISTKERVGKLEPVPGTKSTIDGVLFEVNTANQTLSSPLGLKHDDPALKVLVPRSDLIVHQLTESKSGFRMQYGLDLEVDQAKYQQNFPRDTSKAYANCSIGGSSGPDAPPQVADLYLTSNRPIKYWKEVSVLRFSQLQGYIGHIPTSPRRNQ